MSNIKKEVLVLYIFLSLISINPAYAEEVGCCTNPGAGTLTCFPDRLVLRDAECCPKPEKDFPQYYKSPQNPDNPSNYANCTTNFFFQNKDCSLVDACAIGCCCSELGGTIKSEAQCKGTGLTFYKGQTNCDLVCATPQCNDGIDNDKNGCADSSGGDTGCASPADKEEAGGICLEEVIGCADPNYVPKLSNLQITPIKGQKKFTLKWQDECRGTALSYDVLRCKENGCTNFVLIGTANTNSFEDASADLLFDTTYNYQIKAKYSLQTSTPIITKTAILGNLECLGQFSTDNFCIHESYYNKYSDYLITNFPETFSRSFVDGVRSKFGNRLNKAFLCGTSNNLVAEGTSCSLTASPPQVCVVDDNKPSCITKSNCNPTPSNLFGLFYTLDGCENGRYCFYDRSHTTINSCFSCDTSMACYDYRTEEACSRDNCKVGNCKWKNLANQIGIGVCISTIEYNCQWCEKKGTQTLENLRAFNEVFDFCNKEKSDALSEDNFKCYFRNTKSKNCNGIICTDYGTDQCSNAQITHDENNHIINPSQDNCGIGACQNMNNVCVKNADGDDKADCTASSCERDYFAPNTTLLPVAKKGIVDSLIIQIYDRTSTNISIILKTSSNYATFFCVEPCNSQGHPYNISTTSRIIIISNLNAFDGANGNKLFTLNEGANVVRYYSQDSSKNIGEVKKINLEVHSNTDGPKIFSINVTDGVKVLDKIYTGNKNPTIDVYFFEPAIVTFARLINKQTQSIKSFTGNNEPNIKVSFPAIQNLSNGEYLFELNAKNANNIFMDQPASQTIVIDNNKPTLDISPPDGALIETPIIIIKLTFNKEVNLNSIKLNSDEIKDKFTTIDNKIFTATMNISDGNKKLEVDASDLFRNNAKKTSEFTVDANPTTITLVSPRFGTASKSIFDLVVETDNNAVCKYALDDNLEFEFMDLFAITSGTRHTISNFDKIRDGDAKTHKLYVRCQDRHGFSFKSFDINVDTTPPQIKSAFAFPNPIIEKPSTTTLTVEADEPVVCKYSKSSKEFDDMEGKFEGFDNFTFRAINKQTITVENEGEYPYFVACMNKAELNSEVKDILFKVDLTMPISIISHTPEFFNSTSIVLAIETNKKSQCKYSEFDPAVETGELFGAPGYSHTRQLSLAVGKHTFYVICKDQYLQKFSDVASVTFTIDITPPIILSVNDSSTLVGTPEFTYSKDSLRVKWNSIENESRINLHLYSVIDASTSNTILDWTSSNTNNEWVFVTRNGESLGLANQSKYFFRVRAKNVIGLFSDVKESDGITVDTSLKPPTCSNQIKDSNETDIDCGEFCDQCELGKKCSVNIDCKSNFCNNGICTAPKCDDNIKNQQETDVDCGGSCKKCQNNKVCNTNNDCQTGFCSFGTCKPLEICLDGQLSPPESDVDCGGPCPTKCSEGKNCNLDDDCEIGLKCISSECKKCLDNDKNCNGIPDDKEGGGDLKDSDGDGLPDEWEIEHGLDPNNPNDADLDPDNDGLTNLDEYEVGDRYQDSTDPNNADTDNDGFNDKEEVDAGTNPLDAKDYPKTSKLRILMFTLGTLVLLSGFGYFAYKAIMKRREEKFELPTRREIQREVLQQPIRRLPFRTREEELRTRDLLKRREEQKTKERAKLFEAFGKEEKEKPKEISKEAKPEQKEAKSEKKPKEEVKAKKPAKKKTPTKKPKEDVFIKLKQIATETKKKKSAKGKNATK